MKVLMRMLEMERMWELPIDDDKRPPLEVRVIVPVISSHKPVREGDVVPIVRAANLIFYLSRWEEADDKLIPCYDFYGVKRDRK